MAASFVLLLRPGEQRFVELQSQGDVNAGVGVILRAEIAIVEAEHIVTEREADVVFDAKTDFRAEAVLQTAALAAEESAGVKAEIKSVGDVVSRAAGQQMGARGTAQTIGIL